MAVGCFQWDGIHRSASFDFSRHLTINDSKYMSHTKEFDPKFYRSILNSKRKLWHFECKLTHLLLCLMNSFSVGWWLVPNQYSFSQWKLIFGSRAHWKWKHNLYFEYVWFNKWLRRNEFDSKWTIPTNPQQPNMNRMKWRQKNLSPIQWRCELLSVMCACLTAWLLHAIWIHSNLINLRHKIRCCRGQKCKIQPERNCTPWQQWQMARHEW